MSVTKVQGRSVVLWAFNTDSYYNIWCGQDVSISFDTEELPASSINSGSFSNVVAGRTKWNITFNGVTMVKDGPDSGFTAFDLVTELARRQGLELYLVFTNEKGNTASFQGHAFPNSVQINGSVGQLSKFTVNFTGSGPVTQDVSLPIINPLDVLAYNYTSASGGETQFTDSILINITPLFVFRAGGALTPTTSTPDAFHYRYTANLGKFEFDPSAPLSANELIVILYKK